MEKIRLLMAREIECRVASFSDKWCSLLLYKDARCDMRILDEYYGITGWQRSHEIINGKLFCTVEIWDIEKKLWVKKQDVGTESYSEKEKGEASDSFKRACFNVGIGRELYTAPFICVTIGQSDLDSKGKVKTKFILTHIEYNDDREIKALTIFDSKGNERFSYGNSKPQATNIPKKIVKQQAPAPKPPSDDYINGVINTLDPDADSSLIVILDEINRATNVAMLSTIFSTYQDLAQNIDFKNCLTHKKNEIKAK